MALALGTGPFGPKRAGTFNFDTAVLQPHTLYFDDCAKRVRAEFGGEVVVDSRGVKILHETGQMPVYYVPQADANMDLLQPTDHITHCHFKGDATYWTVRVGDKVAENAVWGYPTPIESAPPLGGFLAFYAAKMDAWYEEDERTIGHPHDPYHRVDVLQSSRHVRVTLDGATLAESDRPKMLFETSLPPRYYLPHEDVNTDALTLSETKTICPYKGIASHWSVAVNGKTVRDAVWGYPEPLAEATTVTGYVCFYDHKVQVEVDGERLG